MTPTETPSSVTPKNAFPALGPTFISADDAAYWVHRQIGTQRDVSYGGVILQRSDGMFVPTLPIQGRRTNFDFDEFLWMGRPSRKRFEPDGFTGAGYYLSNAADHALLQEQYPNWSAEQIKLYLGFYSEAHMALHMQEKGSYAQRHYLSGPDGSLIKYESIQPGRERKLIEVGITRGSTFGVTFTMIQTLAQIGTLSVLVANDQWGGVRGVVPANWMLGMPVHKPEVLRAPPFFGPVSDQASDAILAAGRGVALQKGDRFLGFVLKSASSDDWVATYRVSARHPQTALRETFPTDGKGKLIEVLDYRLEGLYFVCAADGTGTVEPWLYERFFTPADLATGIEFSTGDVYRQEYADFLKVYALLNEGAVLQYQPQHHVSEEPLRNGSDVEAHLRAGTLTPTDYVRRVAGVGGLSVLKSSGLWDVTGRADANWQPYARSRHLSATFVLADDAARFAHEQIGSRRDQAYAGLILQNRDKRYVATWPAPVPNSRFALGWFCPYEANGTPIILAEGYSLYGVYASRWTSDARTVGRDEAEQLTAAQMFTDEDIRWILSQQAHLSVAYLSGSADSLLAYRPDAGKATARRQLQERVALQGNSPSVIAQELASNTRQPDDVVTEFAGTGELRVLIGNDTWGVRDSLFSNELPVKKPAIDTFQPRLGALFATPELAVLDAHARACSDYRAVAAGLGFILKHNERNEYVATETVLARSLDALNQASDFGVPVLIDEYRIHSVYYSGHWLPSALSASDRWFARHFVPIGDLFVALFDDKDTQRLTHHQALSLYIATLDGALLHYRYSPSSRLFVTGSESVGPRTLLSLMAGEVPPFPGVMGKVLAAGSLEVRVKSECWDKAGPVSASWKPYALVQRRRLSPAYLWQDDAVRFAMAQLGTRRERIDGGLVLRRADGLFVATLPVPVEAENFPPNWIRLDQLADKGEFLAGSTVVARYHSRRKVEPVFALSSRERDTYLNMFSSDFMSAILHEGSAEASLSPGTEYLLGLEDSLIRYTRSGSVEEKRLGVALTPASQLQPRQTPVELQMRAAKLTPSEFVNRMAKAGELYVVQENRVWGMARRLSHWAGYSSPIAPALRRFAVGEPALSPVFTQPDDAVRYIHRHTQPRAELMFGFILKSSTSERYMTTLAVPGPQGNFSAARLFPQELLPQGYSIHGLYLCTPEVSAARSDDLHHSFITPQHFARGMDAVRVSSAQGSMYLKLYLSCADGALLRYEAKSTAEQWASFSATHIYEKELEAGQEPLLEYLRKVVRNGELRVVVRSSFWSPFRVDAKGVKTGIGLVRWPQDNRFALGPVFAHADDAARWAQHHVGEYNGKQFLGGILLHVESGSFVAIEPLEDGTGGESGAAARLFYAGAGGPIAEIKVPGVAPLPLPQFPEGFRLAGVHQFYKVVNVIAPIVSDTDRQLVNHLALGDLRFSTQVLKKNAVPGSSCYLSGRGGALLKFTPSHTSSETAVLDEGVSAGVSTFFTKLLGTSKFQVLEVDAFWPHRGPISAELNTPHT
ncbi:hypothetical protein [Pseudomonas sp. PD9R]|uniref:hypothetical protein n=1 Tax=Pseudomonas sp. PD9R TaxID=2853534 RepID=UPI0021092F3A|nr:hypothetical protein [Pseudomonas sp. PD9R]